MNASPRTWTLVAGIIPMMAVAQPRSGLPDVSPTVKGTLVLPVPVGNPLFAGYTETIGQLDAVFQVPLVKRWGLGAGANMTWFAVDGRTLAPILVSGEIRRLTGFAKVQYEEYTTEKTFIELSLRAGMSSYTFDCPLCSEESRRTVPHLAVGFGYYLHATDNLAFGLTVGYARDLTRFTSDDLGLVEGFPGRRDRQEARDMQQLVFGLGFSTRLRRSDDGPRGW